MDQIKELTDVSYNLLKYAKDMENDDSDEMDSNAKAKKSVTLPRIGARKRSPIVFPRIGVQKKSVILQPRIGRGSFADQEPIDDKRSIVYQPRIGRK